MKTRYWCRPLCRYVHNYCISHLGGSKGCATWKGARWGEIGLIWMRERCDWGVQTGTIGQSDALTPLCSV